MVAVSKIWVLVIVLLVSLQNQILVSSQNPTCNSDDLRGLQGFMDGVESSVVRWWPTNSSSSASLNCCNWVGITCNNTSGRVVGLELPKKRLTGSLSDSISNLGQLRTLNLSRNFLNGPLPISLFHLPHLEVIDLSRNKFNGVLPVNINLPALKQLHISDNTFSGVLPSGLCVNSTGVRVLRFAMNYFNGTIPSEFGNCTLLEHLCVAANFLSGNIPGFLFRLPRLQELTLQDNQFTVIEGIGNSSSRLVRLDISSNGLSGKIPDFFRSFPNLRYFSAHSNNLFGGIPPSLSNSPSISSVNLRNNSLNGSVDFNCSVMVNLTSLDLGTNDFSGTIPANLSSCENLKALNLARNKLTGQVPEAFKNLPSLSYLSLSNCSLSDLSTSLKILQHCPNLTVLVLTMNFHTEQLPSDDHLQFNVLKALVIANCRLTGSIPPWLNGLSQLQLLDLSWNHLTGSIPGYLGNFDYLFYLDLSNNSLSGEIPKSLTQLPSLISRGISLEEPSPDFPFFKRRNTTSRESTLQYRQIMSFPPSIDLSSNFLSGEIPPEFGNLKKLHVLDLKHNNLSGTIPSSLSGLRSIETLDLSYNNLTGTIPPSLVNLSFLSKFSVAHNYLRGSVPYGGQFLTFANSSFEGNIGLCGRAVSNCDTRTIPVPSIKKPEKNIGKIVGMAVGICLGTLFLLALMFMVVIRVTSRQEVDPERDEEDEDDDGNKNNEESKLVLFQNNKSMSIDDLLKSTNCFDQSNIIGCGGFGLVFKATLPDGGKVAIKRLSGDGGQVDREFQAEVETLSRAQHPNLVLLQGYCKHKNERLLIYSFMENGSLDYWLHERPDGRSKLYWNTRRKIAQGAIRGLAYLHQSCDPHILHRDIKSSNILLDEDFEAHLADFGLARLILPYDTHVTTDLVGTLGYIPPEYGQASVASYKGDVYSFGVVLLELLTGKRPMDMCKPKGSRDLISWVMQMKIDKRESEVIDSFIFNKDQEKEMLLALDIACVCLNESPKLRPSTQELLSWLDNVQFRTQSDKSESFSV
ncbi:hypothetical protein LXL04_025852 [Taraxacum kok-saghyz]